MYDGDNVTTVKGVVEDWGRRVPVFSDEGTGTGTWTESKDDADKPPPPVTFRHGSSHRVRSLLHCTGSSVVKVPVGW